MTKKNQATLLAVAIAIFCLSAFAQNASRDAILRELRLREAIELLDPKKKHLKQQSKNPFLKRTETQLQEMLLTSPLANFNTEDLSKKLRTLGGQDGRQDLSPILGSEILDRRESVCLVCSSDSLGQSGANIHFGNTMVLPPLADGLKFSKQIRRGFSTGFAVQSEVIATMGLPAGIKPSDLSFVFGYEVGVETFTPDQVYQGAQFIRTARGEQDFSLIRLDRPLRGREALPLAKGLPPQRHELYFLGYPYGLPLKYSQGLVVGREGDKLLAQLNLTTGNCGSPVFDKTTNEVVGMIIADNQEYAEFVLDGRLMVFDTPESERPDETVLPASAILSALPADQL